MRVTPNRDDEVGETIELLSSGEGGRKEDREGSDKKEQRGDATVDGSEDERGMRETRGKKCVLSLSSP